MLFKRKIYHSPHCLAYLQQPPPAARDCRAVRSKYFSLSLIDPTTPPASFRPNILFQNLIMWARGLEPRRTDLLPWSGFTDKMGSFIKQQDIAHRLMWFNRNSHLREVRLWDYFTLHLNINFHPLESPKNSENGAKPWGENRSEYLSNMGHSETVWRAQPENLITVIWGLSYDPITSKTVCQR